MDGQPELDHPTVQNRTKLFHCLRNNIAKESVNESMRRQKWSISSVTVTIQYPLFKKQVDNEILGAYIIGICQALH